MSGGDPSRAALRAAVVLLGIAASGHAASAAPLPLPLERPSDGSVANLSAGPPALHLVFFATWCPPCLDEFRALSELEARWSSRGYRLVLVAVPTRQSRERLSTFLSETRPPGEVLFDVKGAAVKAFAVDRLPSHLLLDARGEVALRSERLSDGVPGAVERLVEDRSRPKGGTR